MAEDPTKTQPGLATFELDPTLVPKPRREDPSVEGQTSVPAAEGQVTPQAGAQSSVTGTASATADALVNALLEGGEGDAGEFTLARDKALELLRQYELPDPFHYTLLLVRGAVRRGAKKIDFEIKRAKLEMHFEGNPLSPEQLERGLDLALHRTHAPEDSGLRELVLGLIAARALGFRSIQLLSFFERPGTVLEILPDGDLSCRPLTEEVPWGVTLRLLGRPSLRGTPKRGGDQRPEQAVIEERCPYLEVPLSINGRGISWGANFGSGLGFVKEEGKDGGRMATYLPPFGGSGSVRFLLDGVWLATRPIDAGDLGFTAVVWSDELRLDSSDWDVVQDKTYDRLMAVARRLQQPLAASVSAEDEKEARLRLKEAALREEEHQVTLRKAAKNERSSLYPLFYLILFLSGFRLYSLQGELRPALTQAARSGENVVISGRFGSRSVTPAEGKAYLASVSQDIVKEWVVLGLLVLAFVVFLKKPFRLLRAAFVILLVGGVLYTLVQPSALATAVHFARRSLAYDIVMVTYLISLIFSFLGFWKGEKLVLWSDD